MQTFVLRTAVNGIALWAAAIVVNGIHLGNDASKLSTRLLTIVLVALVFGLVNAVLKPIAKFFSFPLIVVTLGLFTFVVNALMLQITEWISQGVGLDFVIDHFWWDAVLGSIVITLVSMILNLLVPDER